MKLPAILASDLHLTSNPNDEYRWKLFPWLAAELEAEKAQTLVLLGDLTDAKDYHPAQLVNQVVKEINALRMNVPRIIILKGNHDYLKDGAMFFQFLATLPGVEVISKPTEDVLDGEAGMFLPYTKTPASDWAGWDFSHYRYLFLHQTIKGAVASNGQIMEGERLPPLNAGKVYSGDIHVPQIIGNVEYIGSPYHVHFGDAFTPRCVALDRKGEAFDLHFASPKRLMLDVVGRDGLRRVTLNEGDQVKLRIHLHESEKHEWRAVREEALTICDFARVQLCGLELKVKKERARVVAGDRPVRQFEPREALYNFVDEGGLGGELLDIGLEVLDEQPE